MKMSKNHYNKLESMINEILNNNSGILEKYKNAKMSMMRYRWDLYHTANHKDNSSLFHELYEYLNDDNIDTALKKITNTD